jgi:hypothetical protein
VIPVVSGIFHIHLVTTKSSIKLGPSAEVKTTPGEASPMDLVACCPLVRMSDEFVLCDSWRYNSLARRSLEVRKHLVVGGEGPYGHQMSATPSGLSLMVHRVANQW